MSQDSVRVERAALETTREPNKMLALLRTSMGRNLGLGFMPLLQCEPGCKRMPETTSWERFFWMRRVR